MKKVTKIRLHLSAMELRKEYNRKAKVFLGKGAYVMKDKYVTIVSFSNFYGLRPFKIGNIVKCEKDSGNSYDAEAIKAVMPMIGTVGYLANSPTTIAGGTLSAGRLYDKFKNFFYIRVMFTTRTKVICKIEFGSPDEYESEYFSQLTESGEES